MEPSLFGTDGIRGQANLHPLTPEGVLRLGACLAQTLGPGPHRVVLARDTRASGPMLQAAMAAGLASSGISVDDAGVLPTPAAALYTKSTSASAGVVISASHNPFDDNGLKFFGSDGFKLGDLQEQEITRLFRSRDMFPLVPAAAIGPMADRSAQARDLYITDRIESAGSLRLDGLKIAIDCANGAAFETTPVTLARLGATLSVHHATPSGLNINDRCGSTFPEEISRIVKAEGVHAGVTHDGDADRVLMCDENGGILDGDEIMAIIGRHLAAANRLRGHAIVATIMSNMGLDETLGAAGVRVLRAPVGDRHVLEMMRQHDLVFGGEQSGHFLFLQNATTGDGLLAALAVFEIMRDSGKPLSELRRVLVRYPQAQKAVRVLTKPPLEMVPGLVDSIAMAERRLDGKGRVLVRYSGTEPKLRILVEGPSEDVINSLLEQIARAATDALGG